MKCIKPFVRGKAAFGCGQCMPCRFTRRRTWTHRILLESLQHGDNSFVTLTYAEPSPVSVSPRDFNLWLKRMRKAAGPRRLRFFGVGEYGTSTYRPHYHCALFGWPACLGGPSKSGVCQCLACSVVRETWGYGHVHVGNISRKSAQYIAGYVTKKMTHSSDPRLNGREPEFARMSLRPGIGATAMFDVASEMMRYGVDKKSVDVPLALAFGGANLPLGRYLRAKLRTMIGRDEAAPPSAQKELEEGLSILRRYAWDNDRSLSSVFYEINEPFARQIGAREIIKGRTL